MRLSRADLLKHSAFLEVKPFIDSVLTSLDNLPDKFWCECDEPFSKTRTRTSEYHGIGCNYYYNKKSSTKYHEFSLCLQNSKTLYDQIYYKLDSSYRAYRTQIAREADRQIAKKWNSKRREIRKKYNIPLNSMVPKGRNEEAYKKEKDIILASFKNFNKDFYEIMIKMEHDCVGKKEFYTFLKKARYLFFYQKHLQYRKEL